MFLKTYFIFGMAETIGGGGEMRGGTSYSSLPRWPFENICKIDRFLRMVICKLHASKMLIYNILKPFSSLILCSILPVININFMCSHYK